MSHRCIARAAVLTPATLIILYSNPHSAHPTHPRRYEGTYGHERAEPFLGHAEPRSEQQAPAAWRGMAWHGTAQRHSTAQHRMLRQAPAPINAASVVEPASRPREHLARVEPASPLERARAADTAMRI